jgi:hypothetical protein
MFGIKTRPGTSQRADSPLMGLAKMTHDCSWWARACTGFDSDLWGVAVLQERGVIVAAGVLEC